VEFIDSVRVGVTGTSGQYLLHQYKKLHDNRTDRVKIEVNLRSTLAFTTSTVYLQIWNGITNSWETLCTNNKLSSNTDVSLYGDVSDTSYYDFHNEITIRVYQIATGTSATLSVDMVELCFLSVYTAKYTDKDRAYQAKYTEGNRIYTTKYQTKARKYQSKYKCKQ
jgi:hypothetical protein